MLVARLDLVEDTLNRAVAEIVTAGRLVALEQQQPVIEHVPIKRLISVAKKIAAGQAGVEVPTAASDEGWDAEDLVEAPPLPDLTLANVLRAVRKLARAWNATIEDDTVLTIKVPVPRLPVLRLRKSARERVAETEAEKPGRDPVVGERVGR
jgi:hypothetical protein